MKIDQPGTEGLHPRHYGMREDEMPVYHDGVLIGFCSARRDVDLVELTDDDDQTKLVGWRGWR